MLRTASQQLRAHPLVRANCAALRQQRVMSTKGGLDLVAADQSIAMQKIFHKTSLVSLALTPVAILAHPSALSMPIDLALSVVFPLHAHIGVNWILTDYVKTATPNGPVRMALAATTALCILGLIKCSVADEGLVGTLKATWRGKEKEEAK